MQKLPVQISNFFESIEKYRSEVSIAEIGIKSGFWNVPILWNVYHGQVSKIIHTWKGVDTPQ